MWIRRFILFHGKRHPSAMGLRLMEALTPRVKDLDFARGQITVRDPKWKHDRMTMMPRAVESDPREQVRHAAEVHQEDLAQGWGRAGCRRRWRGIPAGAARPTLAMGLRRAHAVQGQGRP